MSVYVYVDGDVFVDVYVDVDLCLCMGVDVSLCMSMHVYRCVWVWMSVHMRVDVCLCALQEAGNAMANILFGDVNPRWVRRVCYGL